MDTQLFWRALTGFNFLFLLFWVISYTYQPAYMKHSDFVRPGANVRGSVDDNTKGYSDKYLSDPGRSLIFLSSFIAASVVTIVVVAYTLYFVKRKTIRCSPTAKNAGQCDLIDL